MMPDKPSDAALNNVADIQQALYKLRPHDVTGKNQHNLVVPAKQGYLEAHSTPSMPCAFIEK